MSRVSNVFVFSEGPAGGNDPVMKARELTNRRLQRAFTEIDRAIQAGARDKAASAANFAGEELDGMMRQLAQSLLAGGGKK